MSLRTSGHAAQLKRHLGGRWGSNGLTDRLHNGVSARAGPRERSWLCHATPAVPMVCTDAAVVAPASSIRVTTIAQAHGHAAIVSRLGVCAGRQVLVLAIIAPPA